MGQSNSGPELWWNYVARPIGLRDWSNTETPPEDSDSQTTVTDPPAGFTTTQATTEDGVYIHWIIIPVVLTVSLGGFITVYTVYSCSCCCLVFLVVMRRELERRGYNVVRDGGITRISI